MTEDAVINIFRQENTIVKCLSFLKELVRIFGLADFLLNLTTSEKKSKVL